MHPQSHPSSLRSFLPWLLILLLALGLAGPAAADNHHHHPSGHPPTHSPTPSPTPPAPEPTPGVRWGPVIGLMLPDSVSIQWGTTLSLNCTLELNGKTAAGPSVQGIYHQARLTGLTPDKAYTARIVMTSPRLPKTFSAPFAFRTPAKVQSEWTFLAFGDTRTNDQDHRKTVAALLKAFPRPAFLIHTGDLTENGQAPLLWDRFFDVERPVLERMSFLAINGNHEKRSPTYFGLFYTPLSEKTQPCSWYSFRYANAVVLVLDPFDRFPEQTQFIEQVLAAADRDGVKWRLVACHYPCFSSGPHGNNAQEIQSWVPLFEKYKVQLAMFGHDHLYERNFKDGVTYLTLGGGGAPLYQPKKATNPYSVKLLTALHVGKITVTDSALTVQILGTDGKEIDSFKIQ